MTTRKVKATRPEWFTDCVHCLGEVDPDKPHAILQHPDLPRMVACAHIACEEKVRKELRQGATLRVAKALFKPCPPELAARLAGAA